MTGLAFFDNQLTIEEKESLLKEHENLQSVLIWTNAVNKTSNFATNNYYKF